MHTLSLVGFAALAGAVALPQSIDFSAVNALPTASVLGAPVGAGQSIPAYNPTSAASAASSAVATASQTESQKRRAEPQCSPEPAGYGPPTRDPDTAAAFEANPIYNESSHVASLIFPPADYTNVFGPLNGASQQNGYMGYYTLQYYDPQTCANYCNEASGCLAFNIYYERDPSVDPCYPSSNPPSTTNIKCALYGLPVDAETATNTGQYRDAFHVVIAGSYGYNLNYVAPVLPNFTNPEALPGAINAPNLETYIGSSMFPGPYNPAQCAAQCQATTAYDEQNLNTDGSYVACNMFNSYILSDNGDPLGTSCAYYTQAWNATYATNVGQYRGSDYYSVSYSEEYVLIDQVPSAPTGA